MIVVVQRVTSSSVTVDNDVVGSIEKGLNILLGVHNEDTEKDAEFLAAKCADLRVFQDDTGKMNLSLRDIDGEALVISQFTLLGDCSKGRRPNFTSAAPANRGNELYAYFVERLRERVRKVETGVFGADMKVAIANDGPVTIVIDTRLYR